jgi:hypothetical protein
MKADHFIIRIKKVVYESAVSGTISLIRKPPGRRPPENLAALSQWFTQLPEAEKVLLQSAIALAAHQATFGMLAVLDGVRQIDDAAQKGTLELRYVKNDRSVILNDPDSEPLHDLFNQHVSPI